MSQCKVILVTILSILALLVSVMVFKGLEVIYYRYISDEGYEYEYEDEFLQQVQKDAEKPSI